MIDRRTETYINPNESGWEERYYDVLLNMEYTEENIKKVAKNYLEGLEWTYKYYTQGCCDWSWKYKYNYPPLFKDLVKVAPYFNTEYHDCTKVTNPISPLVQLSYVLPRDSLDLLPNQITTQLLKEQSNNYKEDYDIEWSFCKYFWESHVCLPEIDINELNTLIKNVF